MWEASSAAEPGAEPELDLLLLLLWEDREPEAKAELCAMAESTFCTTELEDALLAASTSLMSCELSLE